MKLIHLTDTHLVEPGKRLYGLDPAERLALAIDSINALHDDADLVVITGDLAHRGELQAYVALRASLARLIPPVVPLLGNHDDRGLFREVFRNAANDGAGFVQSALSVPAGRLLFLDTNQPGTHVGWYCEQRLRWLSDELDKGSDAGVSSMLFMHHPPFDVGLQPMDRISLQQKGAFAEVLRPHLARIRHLFFGHVHRPISGSWLGLPFSTLRATSHQVWLDFDAKADIPGSHEPPAYAVVLIRSDTVIVHNHDFLDASPKFLLGEQVPTSGDRKGVIGAQAPVR